VTGNTIDGSVTVTDNTSDGSIAVTEITIGSRKGNTCRITLEVVKNRQQLHVLLIIHTLEVHKRKQLQR
jgi:hypothetical protein